MSQIGSNTLMPMSYLKVFFRRKEYFIIPAFIGLILGICTGMILPAEYRSSTVMMVEEGKTDNPLFNKLAVSTSVTQRLTAIRESMLGWTNLTQLVKRLGLDREIKTKAEYEKLILGIRKRILIRLRGGNIIHLSYTGKDAKTTQAVVQNVTDIFIEKNVDQQNKETSDAITFIESLLRVYEGKIKSSEIAKMQDQLDDLLIDSTEQHPKVKELRGLITAKRKELKSANLRYTESDLIKKASNNEIIDEIKKSLNALESKKTAHPTADPKSEMYKVMLVEKLGKVMARDVGVNTGIYNMLLQRLETAKITQRLQSSKEGTRYTILDPPRVPLQPFKPNKLLVAMMGLFLGTMTGAGLVVSSEFFDKSFLDVEEAKNFLGVPLLGAISKIHTEDSIRLEQEKARWIYSLTIVAGMVVIVVTYTILNFLK